MIPTAHKFIKGSIINTCSVYWMNAYLKFENGMDMEDNTVCNVPSYTEKDIDRWTFVAMTISTDLGVNMKTKNLFYEYAYKSGIELEGYVKAFIVMKAHEKYWEHEDSRKIVYFDKYKDRHDVKLR